MTTAQHDRTLFGRPAPTAPDSTATITIDISGSGARVEGDTRDLRGAFPRPWVWSRRLGCMVLPRNLRPETVDYRASQAVAALAALGVDCEIEGADDRDDNDAREAARLESDQRSLERHTALAGKERQTAAAEHSKGRAIADMIPMGQPILAGHHSQRRHERDISRIHSAMDRQVSAIEAAEDHDRKAASAAYRLRQRDRLTVTAADIRVGDVITPSGGEVLKINRVSVTVPWWGGHGRTETVRLDRITHVYRAGHLVWDQYDGTVTAVATVETDCTA